MKRREFIRNAGLATGGLMMGTGALNPLRAAEANADAWPALAEHKIDRIERLNADFNWPRLVGKNSRLDVHGQNHRHWLLRVTTDQGASGWGMMHNVEDEYLDSLKGRTVAELIHPQTGLTDGTHRALDFPLYDLAGVILDQPVYKLLGAHGPKSTTVYSGMIYFDELEPVNNPAGLDIVMANCAWDLEYGYRKLKVKIGRNGMWYPQAKGLAMDIKVVNMIQEKFADRGVEVLVDANNAYSVDDAIAFMKGIEDVPLYWFEEPFHEEREPCEKLKAWMMANGRENTYFVDGEYNPDRDLCMVLGEEKILDMYLIDIHGFGFSNWINLMPRLKAMGMKASPHAWGSILKTHYTAHLSAGLGNVPTIEGVTCLSNDIDFGDYPVENGNITVSDAPGFGMKLTIES